jgi:hypothetical protein
MPLEGLKLLDVHDQCCCDLGDAGTAGHGGDSHLAGRAVIPHGHAAGAMLVPGMKCPHAVDFRHRGRPEHIAVAHQAEHRIDALAGKGLSQHFIDRQIAHFGSCFEGKGFAAPTDLILRSAAF